MQLIIYCSIMMPHSLWRPFMHSALMNITVMLSIVLLILLNPLTFFLISYPVHFFLFSIRKWSLIVTLRTVFFFVAGLWAAFWEAESAFIPLNIMECLTDRRKKVMRIEIVMKFLIKKLKSFRALWTFHIKIGWSASY